MVGRVLHEPLLLIVGGNALALANGIFWKGARAIDTKRAPIAIMLVGVAILLVAGILPGARPILPSLGLSINAVYLFAAAISLWFGRQERLPARGPIIAFIVLHAAVLAIGVYSTISVPSVLEQVPSLMSLFGVIHFESIIFAVGTAVFVLVLVKERSEAVTRIAAGIDSLTGIANRAAFTEDAIAIIGRCRQEEAPVSVIMFDLDRFKAVNDTYGHAVGDAVIKEFCEVTTAALRPGDVFGRLGGEEFAVVLPWSSIEPAYIRAERIRAGFAEASRIVEGSHVNTTVSGGVSASASGDASLSELLAQADKALYRAKAAGRNRIKRAKHPESAGDFPDVIRVA